MARWWEIPAKIASDKADNPVEEQPRSANYGSHNFCCALAVTTVVLHSLSYNCSVALPVITVVFRQGGGGVAKWESSMSRVKKVIAEL